MFRIDKDKRPPQPKPEPPRRRDDPRTPHPGRYVEVPAQQAPKPDPQPVKKK